MFALLYIFVCKKELEEAQLMTLICQKFAAFCIPKQKYASIITREVRDSGV